MAAFTGQRLQLADYTVAVICPLEIEMSAMRYMLDEEHDRLPRVDGDQNSYVFGKVSGHNVVIGFLPHGSQGIGAAATVAVHMKRSFPSIKLRLLVGLAGGIPSQANDIRLGDVVISMPSGIYGGVVQYDLGKETASGFERKGSLEAPLKEWRDAVVLMTSDHRVRGNRLAENITEMLHRYPRLDIYRQPDPDLDMLFAPESIHAFGQPTCKRCEKSQLIYRRHRESNNPSVFLGLIASGDRVIKDGKIRDQISQQAGGALCFEMEAAGMMNDFQCIVVRGVCDYADSHKNDEWHGYAAATAAACAKELLTYLESEPNVEHSQSSLLTVSSTKRYFAVPNQHVKDFIGREDELRMIAKYFAPPVPERPRVIIIHALGGQGKSQLALECCHRYRKQYGGVFWINASTASSLMQSVLKLVAQLDVSGSVRDATEDVKLSFLFRSLANWKERWLLVYDNCDDPETFQAIRNLIPNEGKIDILLTSRHRGLEQLGTILELPPLSSAAGVSLLLGNYKGINIHDYTDIAIRIVNRLGGLALAIKQAAAYILHQELSIEHLDNFINIYETQRKKILRHTPDQLWEYGTFHNNLGNREKAINAFTTWEMSLQYLYSGDAEQQEAMLHVLTLAAFLAPASISETIFQTHCEKSNEKSRWMLLFLSMRNDGDSSSEDESSGFPRDARMSNNTQVNHVWSHDRFRAFVNLTKKNSLTQGRLSGTRPGKTEFSLHPLIRDWLQLRGSRAIRSKFITEATNMIIRSVEVAKDRNLHADDKNALLPHIDAILQFNQKHVEQGERIGESVGTLDAASAFAKYYFERGQYGNSQTLLEKAYLVCTTELGLDSEKTQDIADSLAETYFDNAQYDKGLVILKEIVEVQVRTLGRDHGKTLKSRAAMCQALTYKSFYETANFSEVEVLLQEIISLDYSILGVDDPSRLQAIRLLSLAMREQQKLWSAERMDRLIIESRQRTLGPEHKLTLAAKHNLAITLKMKGQWEDAEEILRDSLEAQIRVNGRYHPDYLMTTVVLADVLSCKGEYREAESHLHDVMGDLENALGTTHPVRAQALQLFARVLSCQHNHEEALKVIIQALEATCRTWGVHSEAAKWYAETFIKEMQALHKDRTYIREALENLVTPLGVTESEARTFIDAAVEHADIYSY